jgi:hypothetical protein
MKRFQRVFMSLVVLICLAQLVHADKTLGVPLYAQQTNMWCWAASGEMIMSFLGNDVAQCTQANNRFGVTDCCPVPPCINSGSHPSCVQGGWPQYNLYGFTFSSTSWGTALTWSQLKAQIDSNKPVGFSWGWTGGGGHYMVAKGYSVVSGVDMVAINDPWPPASACTKTGGGVTKLITYSEYVSGADHTHWQDDYNITKN